MVPKKSITNKLRKEEQKTRTKFTLTEQCSDLTTLNFTPLKT